MNSANPFKRLLMRGCALLSVTLATASCSWLQSLDKDQTLDWSAEKLYSEARVALDDSNWTQAKDYYQKLEARYPFGQYAQQAQIELIYATWKDGDAPGAVQAADRFLQTYPNHANADYVMYLKALATLNETDSWFNKLAGEDLAERDANASREAFDIFKELVMRYPDSRFTRKRAAACTDSCSLRPSMNSRPPATTSYAMPMWRPLNARSASCANSKTHRCATMRSS